ncbi:MAG: ATP-binding protein [Nannocystales bacterium]
MTDDRTTAMSPFATLSMDARWSIVEVGEGFESITGINAEGVIGKPIESIISRRDRRGLQELDRQRSTHQGGWIDVMLQVTGADGDALVRLRATQSEDGWKGWAENLLSNPGDVLQRLNAETGWCRNVVSRSDEGIVVLNADNTIAEINQSAMDLLAFRSADGLLLSQEVVVGSDFFARLGDERFAELRAGAVKAAKKKKLRLVSEVEHEERSLEIRLSSLHLPVRGHVGCTLSVRDITVQKEVERVSAQLHIKNEDIRVILSNLEQGIFTIEGERRVHPEYSDHLPRILGTDDIGGKDAMDLVFASASIGPDDLARTRCALDLSIGNSTFGFELNRDCFPTRFGVVRDGETLQIEANWVPIASEEDVVTRVMVVLRDVTELEALRDAAAAGQRELTMIATLLAIPPGAFEEYAEACAIGLEETLAAARGEPTDDIALARTIHTQKGNARAWGLKAICNSIHELENHLLSPDRDNEQLAAATEETKSVLESYRKLASEKLNRTQSTTKGISDGEQKLLQEVYAFLERTPDALPASLRALAETAAFVAMRPRLDTIAAELVEHASEGGKEPPSFSLPDDLSIHGGQVQTLHGAFVHLLTNALDHGIDTGEVRAAAGKPPAGHISVTASASAAGVDIVLQDDGKGLALGRLRAKSGKDEISFEEAAEAVFAPGTSTAESVTHSSGRGMGMAAVRSEIEDLGGSITLEFVGTDNTVDYAPFRLRVTLPAAVARVLEAPLAQAA